MYFEHFNTSRNGIGDALGQESIPTPAQANLSLRIRFALPPPTQPLIADQQSSLRSCPQTSTAHGDAHTFPATFEYVICEDSATWKARQCNLWMKWTCRLTGARANQSP